MRDKHAEISRAIALVRMDAKGQGVPCGSGWIPRSKKCSKDKARSTSAEARKRGAEKAREYNQLRGEVKASAGMKPRVKASPDRDRKVAEYKKSQEQEKKVKREAAAARLVDSALMNDSHGRISEKARNGDYSALKQRSRDWLLNALGSYMEDVSFEDFEDMAVKAFKQQQAETTNDLASKFAEGVMSGTLNGVNLTSLGGVEAKLKKGDTSGLRDFAYSQAARMHEESRYGSPIRMVNADDFADTVVKAYQDKQKLSKKSKKELSLNDIKTSDDRLKYAQQELAEAKQSGDRSRVKSWEDEAKRARVAKLKEAQSKQKQSQTSLFGVTEYATDMPLFKLDSFIRFDRGVPSKGTKRKAAKPTCSSSSYNCGSICLPVKKNCNKDDVKSSQERLRKIKSMGASTGDRTLTKGLEASAKDQIKRKSADRLTELQGRKIERLRSRLKDRTLSSIGTPGSIGEVSPDDVAVDPRRFQYKMIGQHTKTGEVGSLSGVQRFDPNLAGIIQVWKDPADGQTYVVNGHNRLALANRLGADRVAVRFLDVPDASTARAVGAITNIAEGRGTPLDAAKFFRETGLTRDDLARKGIPMREKVATDGLALSSLEDSLFRKTIDGELPLERAVIIGGSGLKPEEQRSLSTLIDTEAKRGRKLNNETISELVDTVKSSASQTEQQFSLFGAEEMTRNLAIEKAQLQAGIKKRLAKEKKLFGVVGRSSAAAELERAGNVIDVEQSQNISKSAAQTLAVFDQLKNMSGPISALINQASERVAAGENPRKVQDEIYKAIVSEIPQIISPAKGQSFG